MGNLSHPSHVAFEFDSVDDDVVFDTICTPKSSSPGADDIGMSVFKLLPVISVNLLLML